MSRTAVAAGALLLAVLTAASGAAAPDLGALGLQPYDPPRPAPPIALPDLDGKTWTLAGAHGKVVLLFFWASW
jgi:hypothetical protein